MWWVDVKERAGQCAGWKARSVQVSVVGGRQGAGKSVWWVDVKERAGQCGGWKARSRQGQQQHSVPSRPKPALAPTVRSVVAVEDVL